MSRRPALSSNDVPWFVEKPAVAPASAVRVAELPDRPVRERSPILISRPARVGKPKAPKAKPAGLINWRLVGTAGAATWVGLVGIVLGCWALTRASEPTETPSTPVPAAILPLPEPPLPAPQPAVAEKPAEAPASVVVFGPPAPPAEEPVAVEPPKAEPAPVVKEAKADDDDKKVCRCNTTIDFISDPAEAMRVAQEKKKIVFLLHVSGDFEDPGFT